MVYFWIAVVLLAIVVEAVVPGLVAIWFVPSGIVSGVLAIMSVPVPVQIAVFLALSALFIVFSRTIFAKMFRKKTDTRTNIDAIVGEKCVVTERIENLAGCGQVKVGGMFWSARTLDEAAVYEPGTVVTVRAVMGVKLIVSAAEQE